jgi:hypothetical protein
MLDFITSESGARPLDISGFVSVSSTKHRSQPTVTSSALSGGARPSLLTSRDAAIRALGVPPVATLPPSPRTSPTRLLEELLKAGSLSQREPSESASLYSEALKRQRDEIDAQFRRQPPQQQQRQRYEGNVGKYNGTVAQSGGQRVDHSATVYAGHTKPPIAARQLSSDQPRQRRAVTPPSTTATRRTRPAPLQMPRLESPELSPRATSPVLSDHFPSARARSRTPTAVTQRQLRAMRLAAIEDAEAVARSRLVELVRSHVELLHDLLHQTAPLTLHYVAATPLARGMQPRDADPMSTPRGFVKSQRDANGRTAAGFRASASNAHVAHYDEDDGAQVRQAIEHELRGLRDLQQQLRHRDQMREACVETERLEWAEQRRVLEKRLAAAQKALAVEQRESAALRSQLRALCKSLRPPASYLQTAYPHSSSLSDASDVDAL